MLRVRRNQERSHSVFVPGVLIAAALVYLRGWRRLRNTQPALSSAWRTIAFVSGIALLWVAVASPLGALDHQFLTAHMAQHLLLMTVAAPLILLGEPVIALSRGLPRRLIQYALGRHAQSQPARCFGRRITHPVFCWFASTAVVIGWHIPSLFELGMRSAPWHKFEHVSFLAAGLLFWWPVIQPWPSAAIGSGWRMPMYLFLATLPCDALSAFLVFCSRVVYPHYKAAGHRFDFSPLGDQEYAGALMWVWVTFAYLAPAAGVAMHLLSPGQTNRNVAGHWR
jgi:cytochrome c oxidase assembly factor CtaG